MGLNEAKTDRCGLLQGTHTTMNQPIYTSASEEDAAIQAYVKTHPFPSHAEMLKRMKKDPEVWAEYGRPNHDAMKECYEHIVDTEVCKAAGQRIYARGGMQAMQMNYMALLKYAPFRDSSDPVLRNAPTYLNFAWSGIGPWKA